MNLWDWFQNNESMLSGIAAALVIGGAVITIGRLFIVKIFRPEEKPQKITLNQLSSPSPHEIKFANSDGVKIAYNVQGRPTTIFSRYYL